MHICVCMNICIKWGGIYWPKTKVFTKSKARHVWYVLAKVSNDHRLCFLGRRPEPFVLLPNCWQQRLLVCHSGSKELITLSLNYDIALNLWTKLLKMTKDVLWRGYLKSIFLSPLWGVEVAPARIRILFNLVSCQIGSLELEQPEYSWFQPYQYIIIDCSFPCREVFFGANGNEGT